MEEENNVSSLQQHLEGGSATAIETALNLEATVGFPYSNYKYDILIGILSQTMTNLLSMVVQLVLLVVNTMTVGKKKDMKPLSSCITVGTMRKLRRSGSMVVVQFTSMILSQTICLPSNLPMG